MAEKLAASSSITDALDTPVTVSAPCVDDEAAKPNSWTSSMALIAARMRPVCNLYLCLNNNNNNHLLGMPRYARYPFNFLPLPVGDLGPHLNTWFLGPTRVYTSNGILIGSAVLAQLMVVTNRYLLQY